MPPEDPAFADNLLRQLTTFNSTGKQDSWLLVELPLCRYHLIHEFQQRIVALKKNNRDVSDVLIVVEHHPVFTLGNRGNRSNLLVNEEFLSRHEVDLVRTRRGGDITFHGPGQLVAYPIVSLVRQGVSVLQYVFLLEEVMGRVAEAFGVKATRNGRGHGVWVEDRKLGSVGIAVSRGIAYHGLALNVTTDMTPFDWINPCGLGGVTMTSILRETGIQTTLPDARRILIENFERILEISFRRLPLNLQSHPDSVA